MFCREGDNGPSNNCCQRKWKRLARYAPSVCTPLRHVRGLCHGHVLCRLSCDYSCHSSPLQPILPGGQWRETEEMPSGSNSGSQEPFTHTRLKSHPTGDSTPLSSVLCDTTTSNTVLDSDASTVSLFPQGSYPNDTSNTSLRAPLISSVKRELQRKEEVHFLAVHAPAHSMHAFSHTSKPLTVHV